MTFFGILKIFLYILMTVLFVYLVFRIYRIIFRTTKIIRDNGNFKYFTKAWNVLFRHKALCIYSILFLIYVFIGIRIAGIKVTALSKLLFPAGRKKYIWTMMPMIIHIFVLRDIFAMSIALNVRNIAWGQKKRIWVSLMTSLFYYYPSFIWERFKAFDISGNKILSFQIEAICYVLERGNYKNSIKKAELLKKRFHLFGVQKVLEIPTLLYVIITAVFGFNLFDYWRDQSILAIIAKCMIAVFLGVSMFIDIVTIIYTCQLYFWNQKWEETYSEDLSLGKAAPNIKTIEFPEFNKKSTEQYGTNYTGNDRYYLKPDDIKLSISAENDRGYTGQYVVVLSKDMPGDPMEIKVLWYYKQ